MGTIVFEKDFNIWVMPGDDATAARQVTTDGSSEEPYKAPSQDDEGRIYAARGQALEEIVRIDQDGNELGPPLQLPLRPYESGSFVILTDVSPDGLILAVTTYGVYSTGSAECSSLYFLYTDGSDSTALNSNQATSCGRTIQSQWYSTDRLAVEDDTENHDGFLPWLGYYRLGDNEITTWTHPCEDGEGCYGIGSVDITRTGDRLVVTTVGWNDLEQPDQVKIMDLPGPPPAEPTLACSLPYAPANDEDGFDVASWSPDGSAVAVDHTELGLLVLRDVDTSTCQEIVDATEVEVEGAANPNWSAAPLGASPPPFEGEPDPSPSASPSATPSPSASASPSASPSPSATPSTSPSPTPGGEPSEGPVRRLEVAGAADEPIPLGVTLCTDLMPGSDSAAQVLVARADEFADALAGSALAGDDACILFTDGGPDQTLAPATRTEIDRVLPDGGQVSILGGTSAVSSAVQTELEGAGYQVRRFAGPSRFETAAAIGDAVVAAGGSAQEALLAFGYNWVDAVTGGAFGAETAIPVLLTDTAELHPASRAFLDRHGTTATTGLGGRAVLSDAALNAAPGPRRVAGASRHGTAAAVATDLWGPRLGSYDGFVLGNLGRPDGWTGMLAAAPLSAALDAPQLGLWEDDYPEETQAFLQGLSGGPFTGLVVGDEGWVQQQVIDAVAADLEG
jgi:hypothetical protein